ncbi:MAG: Hsp33 family molecular chaperone HslO [Rhodospirillales bacterium]
MVDARLLVGDDSVLPFVINSAGVRGRVMRLGPVLRAILARHDYPQPVARLLAEFLLLAGGLASMMKYEGVFTLQTRGDGPLRFMVADVTDEGALRGYVELDRPALDALLSRDPAPSLPRLCGAGYLAFTVDRNEEGQRYQGIVELTGASIADCVLHYFQQSEQLPSAIHVATSAPGAPWQAAGMILQRLPASEYGSDHPDLLEAREEGWRRAMILMSTLTDAELLDRDLSSAALVHRLFNEELYALHEPQHLEDRCRCSEERITTVLASLGEEDLAEMTLPDGRVEAVCQFCSRAYGFTPDVLRRLRESLRPEAGPAQGAGSQGG